MDKVNGRLDLWNLFEAIPHAVAAIDGEMKVMAANGRLRDLLAELGEKFDPCGRCLTELFPAVGPQMASICRKLLEEGKPGFAVQALTDAGGNEIVFRLVSVVPGEDDLRLLLVIPPGEKRVKKAAAPVQAESEFKKLAENQVDVLFTTDEQGRIVYISPQIDQYGYTPQEVIYHQVFEYIHPDEREETRRKYFEAPSSNRGGPVQFRLMLKDGRYEWMEVRARHQFDFQGRFVGMSGALRNIGERMELEAARARASRLESLELLAGGIAHDFNNLLTSILGGISLARSLEKKTGKAGEILGEAEKAVVRAGELTRQLLSFARGSTPVRRLTNIGKLLEDSVNLNLLGSNVRSRVNLEPDLWPVNVDQGQIAQVLSNLVINAKQAMPDGGLVEVSAANLELAVDTVQQLDDGRYVLVTVNDSGEGIAPENLEKVFDPYFTTKSSGTGLGLATVFSILRRHGGMITVASQVGEGSEFRVYLPAAEGEVKLPESQCQQKACRRGRILVMDDEEEVSSICKKMLERAGHRVVICSEGAQALALYNGARDEGDPFDMIILDLTVPGGMGGVETVKRLKEIDPDVQAVVSSGYSNDPVMAEPESYGFIAVVPKPYNFEQMKSTVARLLAGKHQN